MSGLENQDSDTQTHLFWISMWNILCHQSCTNVSCICSNVEAYSMSSSEGLDPIDFYVSEINCTGNETRLDSCPQNPIGASDCVGGETLSWWDKNWNGVPYNERINLACDSHSKINTTGKSFDICTKL